MSEPHARLSYRGELDGLRSVAVYLVVAFHAGIAAFGGGFVGVDLFFVLSGFLVTGVLMREYDTEGRVRLGAFYGRRVRRLLPAAVVVVLLTAGLQLLVVSLPARLAMVDDARSALLYVANWRYIAESRDYFAQNVDSSPFLHFWSLSIEEQFYIVFPLLVLAAVRFTKRPAVALVAGLGALGVGSVVWQVVEASRDVTFAYYSTPTRVYQLLAGALLMLLVRRLRRPGAIGPVPRTAWCTALVVVGAVGLVLVAGGLVDWTASARGLGATASGVAIVAGLWWSPRGPAARALAVPPLRYLGQVSYGTYLWHWPVLLVLERTFRLSSVNLGVVTAVLATGLAALSAALLETPIRSSARLARLPWVTAGVGVAVSAVVAGFAVSPVLNVVHRPEVPAPTTYVVTGPDLDVPVPADLDLVGAASDIGPRIPNCTVEEPDACTVVHGPGLHVLLVGDSQARQLGGALKLLARAHGWTYSQQVTSGCAWQVGQTNDRSGDAPLGCSPARTSFYRDVLPQMGVDVVIAFGLSRDDAYWAQHVRAVGTAPANETIDQIQQRTSRTTAQMIRSTGADLVIVHSMFGTGGYGISGFNPLECLAAAETLSQCAVHVPIVTPPVDGLYDVLATSSPRVATFNVNTITCPAPPVCSPILDGQVIWRDPDHVTATFFTEHRESLMRRLIRTGFFGVDP